MKTIQNLNRSYKLTALFFSMIFLLLFICNYLTPMIADDYSYCNSFLTDERITSVTQIFPSLRAHADTMNGRLVAHFWAQLFLLLPSAVFDIVNALMFTLQLFLMYYLCLSTTNKKNNNMLIPLAFGCIWLFQPVFGQVNLWLDGSCNYLWAIPFGLIYIIPYVHLFIKNKPIKNIFLQIIFPVFSFFAGAYSENGSAAFIFIAALLTLATLIFVNKRIPVSYYIALAFSVLGYLSIYMSPAQVSNKGAELSLYVLRNNFVTCFSVLKTFWILPAIYVVLLVFACFQKVDYKQIMLSVILASGAMLANFMMMFAGYYAHRSAFCVVAILTLAVLVLFNQLTFTSYKGVLVAFLAVLLLPVTYNVVYGTNDIYNTYLQDKTNKEIIMNAKANNEDSVTITIPAVETKYSAAYATHYADTKNPESWPNTAIAKYYGIDTVSGKW